MTALLKNGSNEIYMRLDTNNKQNKMREIGEKFGQSTFLLAQNVFSDNSLYWSIYHKQ